MLIYWLMFALPVLGMTFPVRRFALLNYGLWLVTGAVYVCIIGLRHEVGWDWPNYLIHIRDLHYRSLLEAVSTTDPGYAALAWLGERLGLGLYFVNTLCAAVMVFGLMAFARRQPDPWLSLLVAVPYALIVVGIGYTRQSAAIGMEFLALLALLDRKLIRFGLCVLGAALFHKSAIALLPLAILYTERSLMTRLVIALVLGAAVLALSNLLADFDVLRERYIEGRLVSEGANTRLAINALPAGLYLLLRRYIPASRNEQVLMLALAAVSVACLPLGLVFSTATDRLALFLLPIQMLVWGRIALIFASPAAGQMARVAVVALYGAIQFVWLNYAIHASAWIPYSNVLWRL